ncbi:MAG: tetratricopeptide repeat protein [Planctomycetota bacterium]
MRGKKRTHPKPKAATAHRPPVTKPIPIYRVLPFILLFFLVSIAYLNADHQEFIFDSCELQISDALETKDFVSCIKRFWLGGYNPDAPLTFLSFSLNYIFNRAIGLEGFDITTFLIFNVIVHALNASLLYLLIRSFLQHLEPHRPAAVFIPLATAALFAVHPLAAGSVAYIFQRRGTLAATFYLLAILSYLRVRKYHQSHKHQPTPGNNKKTTSAWPWRRIALAAAIPLFYWLSFRAKNMGLTLPFAILAIEFCLRAPHRHALKRYLIILIPATVLCISGMFVFLWIRGLFDPVNMKIHYYVSPTAWGPWYHFLTEARVFIHYWKLLLLPLPAWCCIDHSFSLSTHLLHHGAIIAITFHTLLLILAVTTAFKRYTLAAIGIFWFYIVLIPYILLPQTELFVEYKTYLPSVGLAMIVAEAMRRIRYRIPFVYQISTVIVIAAILLAITIYRNRIYQSPYNAWADAVAKSPHKARPHLNFGNALVERGKLDQAMFHFQQALKYRPDYHVAYDHLASILLIKGKTDQAIEYYNQAIKAKPDYPEAYNNLAAALAQNGQIDRACQQLYTVLKIQPDYPGAHRSLARLLVQRKQFDQAVHHYQEALRYNQNDIPARKELNALSIKLRSR